MTTRSMFGHFARKTSRATGHPDIEELSDHELDRMRLTYLRLAARARERLRAGEPDTGTPEVGADEGTLG